MRTGAASAARCHNENDVTMTIAGIWRYGDWRHVATGCTALVRTELHYGIISSVAGPGVSVILVWIIQLV